MSNVVWKYEIPETEVKFTLDIPEGADFLHVREQNNVGCMWFAVDPAAKTVKRNFYCMGTGGPIPPHYDGKGLKTYYRGTIILDGGATVQHVFEQIL